MNVRISFILDLLEIDKQDIGLILIEYIDGQGKLSLYKEEIDPKTGNNTPEVIYISVEKLSEILTFLLPFEVGVGTDHISIYDKLCHKKITYLRVFLPQALAQIDYEEDTQNFDFEKDLTEKFRGLLRRV